MNSSFRGSAEASFVICFCCVIMVLLPADSKSNQQQGYGPSGCIRALIISWMLRHLARGCLTG